MAGDYRGDGAAVPADCIDRAGGGAGDDSAVTKCVLRTNGGGDHGRVDRGDGADAAVFASVVCGLVPGQERAGLIFGLGGLWADQALGGLSTYPLLR